MDSLMRRIVTEITRPYHRLSVVSNPDGFLGREDTIRAFAEQAKIEVKRCTQLELRVWFELEYYEQTNKYFIVLVEDTTHLLADIRQEAIVTEFNTRELFLTYNQQAMELSKMNYAMLAHLFENKSIAILNKSATDAAITAAESRYGRDGDDVSVVKANLAQMVIDWQKPHRTMEQIANQVVKVSRQGKFEEIEEEIEFLNASFQTHLDNVYYQQLMTATAPRVVHKILPYMARTYMAGQKVALVVVDGLSYWQYTIFRNALNEVGITTHDDVCYAWLPSVTQLSRQSIFRGGVPERDYRQSPTNEEKLWKEFWLSKNFEEWHVKYAYETLDEIPSLVERLAFVTMTMDDDMHSAHSMKQLYRSTEDWAKGFTDIIRKILDAGFDVILTADHGGVPSYGWGNLTWQEKTALYETGSRGQRHLIFNNQTTMQHFMAHHPESLQEWMIHGDSIVWRNNKCFGTDNCITHGGSHMLEMLVPLVTIKRQ